jgi:hypothetical protein
VLASGRGAANWENSELGRGEMGHTPNGNLKAHKNLDVNKLFGLAATLTGNKHPLLKRLEQTMGDLTQQALCLARQTQGGCQ